VQTRAALSFPVNVNKSFRPAFRRRATLLGLVSPLLLAPAAHAQTAPPAFGIGDAIREGQPQMPPVERVPARPRIVGPDAPMLALPGGATLHVERFRIEGDADLPEAELQAEVAGYRGRDLTFAQLQEAAARVAAVVRRHGFLLAQVVLPQQDAGDGTLLMQVMVGRFGKVTVHNRAPVRDALVAAPFERLSAQGAVSRAAIERAMLIAGDLPGASLPRVAVNAGEVAGSSDFVVDVDAGPRVDGYVLGDTNGSSFTGRNRLSAGVGVNSPLGIGDRLSGSAMVAAGSLLLSGRAAYSLPLGDNGLRAEFAASKTRYELGAEFSDLDASGTSLGSELNLSQALLRSRDRRLDLTFGLTSRRLRDKVIASGLETFKQAQSGTLALVYDDWAEVLDRRARRTANLGLTRGHLSITDPEQLALNRAGANTTGSYTRLTGSVGGSLEARPGWTVLGSLGGQQALNDKNLDSSEQFAISGANGVRAYREWVSGDNGWLASATLRRALPAIGPAAHSLGVFADSGRSRAQQVWRATPDGTRLSDAGVVWRLDWGQALAQLQYARAVGPHPAGQESNSRQRLLFQLGASF